MDMFDHLIKENHVKLQPLLKKYKIKDRDLTFVRELIKGLDEDSWKGVSVWLCQYYCTVEQYCILSCTGEF